MEWGINKGSDEFKSDKEDRWKFMNLIISFSGRVNGNCDLIAQFISDKDDEVIYFRDKNVHACSNCEYECMKQICKYRDDDIYFIYDKMLENDKVILIVPMYCGNPPSLYFIFNERCQDYFMHNEDKYEEIVSKLYIIGVYGKKESTPEFIPCFEKCFEHSKIEKRVLGIERHKYNQTMNDSVLDVMDIRKALKEFLK